MSKNSVVSLTLQVKGQQASQELKRIATEQVTAVQRINTEQQKLAPIQATQINNAKKISDELRKQGQAFTTQKREVLALDTARKLGIRTEQQITTEIKKTQGAYTQLSILQRQGLVTAKDMERAYASMKSRVAALNTELGKTVSTEKQIQQIQKTGGSGGMSTLQRGGAVAGAVVGAGYVMQRPVRDAMQYEKDLAQLSINAYDNPDDRKTGQNTLRSMISKTAKQYGQTTDDVLTGLNSLMASGKYKGKSDAETEKNLENALSAAAEAAQASGGDILDFAQLSIAAKSKNISEREYMGYAVQAGKEGNFETRDLAKHLSTQSGMLPSDPANRQRQASQLMALNQVAMSTAGTADQAGNNVTNLLSKMGAESTKKTFKKDYGINLDERYLEGAKTGKTRFDVFGEALNEAMQKDIRYKKVISDLGKTNNSGEREQILLSQQGILEQSALSNILPDMQALAAGVAFATQLKEFNRITTANQEKGLQSLTEDAGTMRDTAGYGVNQLTVTKKNSEFEAMGGFNEALGDVSIKLSKYADEYPKIAEAVAGATVAISALAVAAGGAALVQFTGGKGSAPDLPIGTKTKGAPKVKGSNGLKAAGLAGLAYTGYELFEPIDDYIYSSLDKIRGGSGERPDFVQQAIDKSIAAQSEQNAELVAKQEQANQLSQEMIGKLNSLISVTQQNKPIPFSASGLLGDITKHAATEEKRHGVDLLSYGQK
ncbi:hypothetical protein B9T36_07165 [Acinetobacter sp. ANC 4204]|uniref:hypothetical protein n=1 Tax=Acinetobacter sp. ANC 4204 TaxID=1977884 RepID=UPI000A349178|nr:hypothetical protein [Acinetobacter sp. ANC 4204]OTG60393.1 hypothetical protein B9T36_07165 [Acinetobacter sp. ANC 4204]